jgi:hypothetical protein
MKTKIISKPGLKFIRDCTIDEDFFLVCPPHDQIAPKAIFAEVKKVMEMSGGAWNVRESGWVFDSDPTPIIDKIVDRCYATNKQQVLQSFDTPNVLATDMAKLVLRACNSIPVHTLNVLEPSAGVGNLIAALECQTARPMQVAAFEIDAHRADMLKARCPSVRVGRERDFLNVSPEGFQFHAVLMNPPFDRDAWAAHVVHALRFLCPQGVLVAVVPRSATLGNILAQCRETAILTPVQAGFDPTLCHLTAHSWYPTAILTPVQAVFDGTLTQVSILTVGISPATVKDVLGATQERPQAPVRKAHHSLNWHLKCLKMHINRVNRQFAALEALHDDTETLVDEAITDLENNS